LRSLRDIDAAAIVLRDLQAASGREDARLPLGLAGGRACSADFSRADIEAAIASIDGWSAHPTTGDMQECAPHWLTRAHAVLRPARRITVDATAAGPALTRR